MNQFQTSLRATERSAAISEIASPRDKLGARNDERGLTRSEFLVVAGILLAIALVSLLNFRGAVVKGRDIQRKNDLKHIGAALNVYFKDVNSYPPAQGKKIFDCATPPKACSWGSDSVVNPEDGARIYIDPLPEDPLPGDFEYVYLSNKREFQLLAHLERALDVEYNENIAARGIMCGRQLCNFGVGSADKVDLTRDLPADEE